MRYPATPAGRGVVVLCICVSLIPWAIAGGQQVYQKPPQTVLDVLHAPSLPTVSVSPSRDYLMMVESVRYPSIAELARPMLRLAGLRIDPATNGIYRPGGVVSVVFKRIADGKEIILQLPKGSRSGTPVWSPDGKQVACTVTTTNGIELWIGEASTGRIRRLGGIRVSAVMGPAVQWLGDSRSLLVQHVPANRGRPPAASAIPTAPDIQESDSRRSTIRTYEDLLTGPHDEALFDYYSTSQLAVIDSVSGAMTDIGAPAIFRQIDPSPDGSHLLVTRIKRPYSYLRPASMFPSESEVWDRSGVAVHKLAVEESTEERQPGTFSNRPRSHQWRPTEPSTLVWIEPSAGRDRLVALAAPFTGEPDELLKPERRISSIQWGERDGLVLVSDGGGATRESHTIAYWLGSARAPKLLSTRNARDRYTDPGTPVMRSLPNGERGVAQSGDSVFLAGQGASPDGDRPFLDKLDLNTATTQRLFRCDDYSYESFVALLADDGSRFITRRESESEPPNYLVRSVQRTASATATTAAPTPLTMFRDPSPQIRGITKKLVSYKRSDGVSCSFTLYLPPDYKEGTRLPTVVWAYPREFEDPEIAGQISGSTERFTSIVGISHLFFLLQGYAVLDNASMPIVGSGRTANDTFVEQIVMSAKAAIDKAVELGVTDRDRVGVGGHSYGAFMTANLLAHCDLFRAGIARSGAYNRTLTPFGFQNERRTLWQAGDLYVKMSPFMAADKINEPILLIHGEADNNPGTFPIQTERLYQAIRGNGGRVRSVMLPLEAHGYTARESVEHVLYEMISWFDKYVKNAPARTP